MLFQIIMYVLVIKRLAVKNIFLSKTIHQIRHFFQMKRKEEVPVAYFNKTKLKDEPQLLAIVKPVEYF